VLSPIADHVGTWHAGRMPVADTVLLPLAVGLTLLGIIITGIAWRRGRRGRVVQGVGLALAPVALYFSGLLRLVWNGVVAIVGWAARVVFSPAVWFGLSLLALCVVLWVVGGIVARRSPSRKAQAAAKSGARPSAALPANASSQTAGSQVATRQSSKKQSAVAKNTPPVDDDMAEIEALLKSRGIN
jgi:hypothetical protein